MAQVTWRLVLLNLSHPPLYHYGIRKGYRTGFAALYDSPTPADSSGNGCIDREFCGALSVV